MKTFNELCGVVIFFRKLCNRPILNILNFSVHPHFHDEWSSEKVSEIQGKHYSQRISLGIYNHFGYEFIGKAASSLFKISVQRCLVTRGQLRQFFLKRKIVPIEKGTNIYAECTRLPFSLTLEKNSCLLNEQAFLRFNGSTEQFGSPRRGWSMGTSQTTGNEAGKKKLKGPGPRANLSSRSQLTFAPEESAEHDDCRQQEWIAWGQKTRKMHLKRTGR